MRKTPFVFLSADVPRQQMGARCGRDDSRGAARQTSVSSHSPTNKNTGGGRRTAATWFCAAAQCFAREPLRCAFSSLQGGTVTYPRQQPARPLCDCTGFDARRAVEQRDRANEDGKKKGKTAHLLRIDEVRSYSDVLR